MCARAAAASIEASYRNVVSLNPFAGWISLSLNVQGCMQGKFQERLARALQFLKMLLLPAESLLK